MSEAIFTESIVLLATALADLPAGFIASKVNNKSSLLAGALLHVVSIILLGIGSSLAVFTISALLMGIAWAFVSGADEAYIHDDFIENKDDYKKVFATSTIVDEVATIVGMLSASLFLYAHTGLRWLFGLAAVVLIAHFVYTWLVLPKSQPLPPLHPEKATRLLRHNLFKDREVLMIIPLMVAFAVIYEAVRPLWQPHMQQLGINIASFGIIFAVLKLASLGGSVLARYRAFHARDVGVVFALMLVALLTFGTSLKVISIVALCVYLFTENYFRVYMSTVLNRLIHHNRAAVLSFGSVVRNAVGALIVAGAGALSGISIFVAVVVVVAIKIPAIVYILRLNRRIV